MHAFLFVFSRSATGMRFSHRGSRYECSGVATPAFDKQGGESDVVRVDTAMRSFVTEFGVTTALHMSPAYAAAYAPVRATSYVSTRDAKYTPIYKLELLRRAYFREASPFAPLVRVFGLVKKPSIVELEQWQELLYDSCTMCGRCTLICPMGIDIAELVKEARHGMFKAGWSRNGWR